MVRQVRRVPQDLLEHLVSQVHQVLRVLQDLQVLQDRMDQQGHQVLQVLEVQTGLQEHKDPLVIQELVEHQELRDLWELQDL